MGDIEGAGQGRRGDCTRGGKGCDEGRRVKLTRVSLVQLVDLPWEKSKKRERTW